MIIMIDWPAHHTTPEIADQIKELMGKRPDLDPTIHPILSNESRKWTTSGYNVHLVYRAPVFTPTNCQRNEP